MDLFIKKVILISSIFIFLFLVLNKLVNLIWVYFLIYIRNR